VDGQWIHDPNNNLREPDGHKGYNSTYFHHNYTFRLNGYPSAKKVVVAGSFNEWNEKQLVMQKAPGGWELDLYLGTGSHTYKFIIDGAWLLDPENKVVRPDGQGHFNSAIALGDTSIFTLRGYTNARLVILTGNFNGWNTAELAMIKTATGWELPYVVAPGNHEYKYIVDGQWITDPGNPVTVGKGDTKNSVKPVKPNYTFVLKRYPNAREVWLSGNFNGWAEPGYQMVKKDGVWICPLHLSAGKYTYKFVVDGQWILDPDNPQREENEYSTGNSVLWIEPEGEFLQR
jgi:1,4-alpha-glucan branching enzyme